MILVIRQKKNAALTLTFPLTDSDGQPITGAAGLDSERSQDGGGFSDCTNEAAEIGTTGFYSLALTAAELNYGVVVLNIKSSTAGIMPAHVLITTYTEPLDDANTELAAVPASTAGLRAMIQHLFENVRHKKTMNKDTGVETLFKDDGAATLGTATHSTDGTTVTRGEMS